MSEPRSRRDFLRVLGALLAAPATPSPTPRPPTPPPARPSPTPSPVSQTSVEPNWLQALRPLTLWSGPDDAGIPLGTAARWDYFAIARPQVGGRIYVNVARTHNYAWVDSLAVGPSGPPPPGWPPADAPPPPDNLNVGWVAALGDVTLYADAAGTLPLGVVPAWTAFKQVAIQDGPRLRVQDPYSDAEAWLDARYAGPIDPPARVDVPPRWWGVSYVDGANLRASPSTTAATLGALPAGLPIIVTNWVAGEEVIKDNP